MARVLICENVKHNLLRLKTIAKWKPENLWMNLNVKNNSHFCLLKYENKSYFKFPCQCLKITYQHTQCKRTQSRPLLPVLWESKAMKNCKGEGPGNLNKLKLAVFLLPKTNLQKWLFKEVLYTSKTCREQPSWECKINS